MVVGLTVLLYEVHRGIRKGEQLVHIFGVLRAERHADTCLNVDVHCAVSGGVAFVQLVDDIHGDILDVRDIILICEAEHELIAAESACETAPVVDLGADRVSHESDDLVADGVTVAVVDELEVVDVNEGNSNALCAAALDLRREVSDKCVSVIKL